MNFRPVHRTDDSTPHSLRICIINPRFEPSYWGMNYALPLLPGDKRNWAVTGALPALAALAPPNCAVVLLDENVEPIDYGALEQFDVIGVTGMIVQRQRMREILARLKKTPATVVVGGPCVSVSEAEFVDLCDIRFIGEAEETWPAFLTAYSRGEAVLSRYEQLEKSDMGKVPTPRYDLLKADHYVTASLQFSRGCPFLCEFCDIITLFGRRPRTKTPEQMIAEFDAIRRAGFRSCFLVDDNFIGNKRKAKELLAALIEWQQENRYPISLSTQASINLADEPELIELMVAANFRQVFIGVESPRAASLSETRKVQNVRGDSLEAKLRRIRDGGLVVQAGFIVGFDNDDEKIFDELFGLIERTGIAQALVAILSPVPTTPLYDRLKTENRLDFSHPDVKFLPLQMSREALKQGYNALMQRLYEPDAYFDRLLDGYVASSAFRQKRAVLDRSIRRGRGSAPFAFLGTALLVAKLLLALLKRREGSAIGSAYLRHWKRNRSLPADAAIAFSAFARLCAEHWHYFMIANSERKGEFGSIEPREFNSDTQGVDTVRELPPERRHA